MAIIQWNALSTSLFGSFEALTILPDAARMTAGRMPVLYLLHDNGENALQFLRSRELEALCGEKGIAVCCPWISHSFGIDYCWGGKFGHFAAVEFPGICENLFAVDNSRAMIGGVGTGAYAACVLARENPGRFRKVFAFDGRFDPAAAYQRLMAGEQVKGLTLPMMEAAFGSADSIPGSGKDLFSGSAPEGIVLGGEDRGETRRLADAWGVPVHDGTLARVIASEC